MKHIFTLVSFFISLSLNAQVIDAKLPPIDLAEKDASTPLFEFPQLDHKQAPSRIQLGQSSRVWGMIALL